MRMTRRQFLGTMGKSCLFYTVSFVPGADRKNIVQETMTFDDHLVCVAAEMDIDYKEWIVFNPNGNVTIFTNRMELGQGLKTVLTATVTQALDIAIDKLTLIMGDTDLCPQDGPTVGSAATRQVGWGFWLACQEIRNDLILRTANSLEVPPESLEFSQGGIRQVKNPSRIIKPTEVAGGKVVRMVLDPKATVAEKKQYVDLGLYNANAKEIVTGTLKYVGDLKLPGMLYADWHTPPYHQPYLTKLISSDLSEARAVPAVERVEEVYTRVGRRVVVLAKRYHNVVKALHKVKTQWSMPTRPKELRVEKEIRERAEFVKFKEQKGNVASGLAASYRTISETYLTQNTAVAQIETDTALAKVENGGTKITAWVAAQWPHEARRHIAKYMQVPESYVHVVGMPVGGAFGFKIAPPVTWESAILARMMEKPVKVMHSRKNQFKLRSRYKMACLIDLTTGVSTDGRMLARRIDTYQDAGSGTVRTYDIPHVSTRLFKASWPYDVATSRGTSFVQNCFAIESHVDMVARAVGLDPFTFRSINVEFPAFVDLINACAEMVDYNNYQPASDEGIGLAICNHGNDELGAVAAEVAVNPSTGVITVKRICAAFDIGTVINHRTALACLRGGIIWGIGYSLFEQVKIDGHSAYTEYLTDYHIPMFSDTPPIEVRFLDNHAPGAPRGCGELPIVPTIGAIANAFFHATGIRIYSTPLTPDKVRKALGSS